MPPPSGDVLPGWNPQLVVPWWVLVGGLVSAGGLLACGHFATRGLPVETGARPNRWRLRDWIAVFTVLAAALGLRLAGLDHRFDADEPQLLGIRSLAEWSGHYDVRLHPPLVPLAFGWATAGELDLTRARQLSIFAGALTAVLVYVVGQRRSGSAGGLAAGALVAVAPAAVHSSQLARGYSFLALGVVASYLALSVARTRSRTRYWVLYSVVVSLSLATEYLAILPVVADALVVFFLARGARTRISLGYALAAAGMPVSFLVATVWPTMRYGVPVGGDLPTPGALVVASDSLDAMGGLYPGALLPCFLVTCAVLWWRDARRQLLRPLVVATVVVVATLVLAEFTFSRPRYLLHALPLLSLLVAALPRTLGTGLGLTLAGAFVANQAAALPCYYDPHCSIAEVSVQIGSLQAEARLSQVPVAHVVVDARVRLDRYLWALDRELPASRRVTPCAGELCWRLRGRTYYEFGARRELDLDIVHRNNPESVPVFLVTGKDQSAPRGCTPEVLDAGVDLYRCVPAG